LSAIISHYFIATRPFPVPIAATVRVGALPDFWRRERRLIDSAEDVAIFDDEAPRWAILGAEQPDLLVVA
jgi:hypothetical protein